MIEYLEVYDADGNPTGVAHPRSKVHREGLFHKTVFIWVLDSNLNVLIQQRASCKESSPNLFDVSSAGHITWGDTTEQTVLKELNEELGLVATFDENEAKQKKIPMMKLMKAKNFISHVFPERNYTDNEFFDIFVVIIPQIFIPQQNDAKSSTDSTESSPQMQENLQDFSIQTVKMQESEVQSCFKVNFFLLKVSIFHIFIFTNTNPLDIVI